jgi:predicted nucleic acid-binding protein
MPINTPCVVDASVMVKLFLQEDLSEDVQQIVDDMYLDAPNPDAFIVPDLFFVECANILRSKVRFNGYPPQTAMQAMRYLQTLALPTTSTADLVEDALAIAFIHNITAYDAVYVALAARQGIPLLTADARLGQQLQGSAHELLSIQDYVSLESH